MHAKKSKHSDRKSLSSVSDPSCPRPLKVLVVEDHADSAETLALMLATMGHTVKVALSISDAVRLAQWEHFDLLVSDLWLGDGNGLHLMRELRVHQPGLKGIAISGDVAEDIELLSCGAGFCEHLTKPFDFDLFEEIITRVAGSHQQS